MQSSCFTTMELLQQVIINKEYFIHSMQKFKLN